MVQNLDIKGYENLNINEESNDPVGTRLTNSKITQAYKKSRTSKTWGQNSNFH